MKVIIMANVEQEQEIKSKKTNAAVELIFIRDFSALRLQSNYDAFFYLGENDNKNFLINIKNIPVFINSTITTLEQAKMPGNFTRINGWPGFLKRDTWEFFSYNITAAKNIFTQLGWHVVFVKDTPGFIAARVICMIINEAYFALEEGVSTIEEINLAMKLGTNYPYGPFEWEEKIGLPVIFKLLKNLSVTDRRYLVSTLLEQKILKMNAAAK